MKKIFVVGSLNMDLVISAPFMPENGVTITGENFMTNPGGKGANQAVAAGKLGGDVYMVGAVGVSFGAELKKSLQDCGVHTQYVRQVENVSSGIAVIVVVDGDNRIILDKGANALVEKEWVDCAFVNAQEGDYLVLQLEISQDIVRYALQKAKEKKMITLLNPAPAATLQDGVLEYCDYFVVNQSEAEFYTGVYPKDENSVRTCAETLQKSGVKNILVTMGADGSACLRDGVFYSAKAFPVKAVDTTAAGDTYVGAFVVGLSENMSVDKAMTFASKASAITVMRYGAQKAIPLRVELDIQQ